MLIAGASLREGAAGGAPLAALFPPLLLLLPFVFVLLGPPCPVVVVVLCFLVCTFSLGRIGQSAPAMALRRNAAAGSNTTAPIFAIAIFDWKKAAWAKAQPAISPKYCANVHSWRSAHHSPEVSAKIYTGHGRH